MRSDRAQVDAATLGRRALARSGQPDEVVALPRPPALAARLNLPWRRLRPKIVAAHVALLTLIAGAGTLAVFAAARPSVLVSTAVMPSWMAGPLHGLFGRLFYDARTLRLGLSGLLVALSIAYAIVLVSARSLSPRLIIALLVALHAALLLSPPLFLTDVFNYLGYARLGSLHHLNPYTHALASVPHDPAFRFTTWHDWQSPYGPLFTAATYPLAHLPIPAAYWVLKTATVLASLGFIAVLWRCARQLGHDPRTVVLLVAANPIYLVYAIGGFHNDFFMLGLSTGAIALLLARRDRAAGAALVIAIGVKFTVVLVVPFLLVACETRERRLRLLTGAALAAVPAVAVSVLLFGFALPNVAGQSALVTAFSIPNLAGLAVGDGGATPGLVHVFEAGVVLVVAYGVMRRRDWLAGAGWATLALLASLAWLMPWYVIWALPLAALSSSAALRRVAIAFAAFVLISFIPATDIFLRAQQLNPPISAAGKKVLVQGVSGR